MMKTKNESKAEMKQEFIGERLSPSKLRQYIDLMKLFRSKRIEGAELIKSLLILFEEDECLTQVFKKLMETEIRELKKNEIQEPIAAIDEEGEGERRKRKRSESKNDNEVEEGEIREEHHRRVRVRSEVAREETDKPIKKRSKYRLEPTGPVLGPEEYRSEINQNCGEIKNSSVLCIT